MTKVLVTGATGQDAFYLMPKLAHLGYEVFGTVRGGDPARLKYLQDIPFLHLIQADLLDFSSLMSIASALDPDVIINTAGVTSPPQCWGTPELAAQVNGVGALRLLDIYSRPSIKYIQFGSVAEFGPYGAAKKYAEIMLDDWRERGFHTTTIKFVGHHSPRRSTQFFSRKVTKAVADIKAGRIDKLILGDVSRLQDWGDASEFMDAVVDIINMPPGNYTIGTNLPRTLADWVETAFKVAGLEAADWVEYHQQMVQPTDVPILSARTSMPLSWRATRTFEDLCRWMVEADLKASP